MKPPPVGGFFVAAHLELCFLCATSMDIPLYIYLIPLTILLSVVYNYQHRPSILYFKIFPFYLTATLATELVAIYMGANNMNNITLYNYFSLIMFMFYYVMLYGIITSKNVKKIIAVIFLIYPILFFLNLTFVQTLGFVSFTYSIGCLLVTIFGIYYLYEIFQMPTSIDLRREPSFWFCVALLFFYPCTYPYFGLAKYIIDVPTIIFNNITTLLNLMNVLLYSLFTIAFLCRIRIRRFT
jgi:hypothetical protein